MEQCLSLHVSRDRKGPNNLRRAYSTLQSRSYIEKSVVSSLDFEWNSFATISVGLKVVTKEIQAVTHPELARRHYVAPRASFQPLWVDCASGSSVKEHRAKNFLLGISFRSDL